MAVWRHPKDRIFRCHPVEDPALRELMPGKYRFVIGMSNDEIGYILPKSQWDEEAPFTYSTEMMPPTGKKTPLGPETASILYKEFKKILNEL